MTLGMSDNYSKGHARCDCQLILWNIFYTSYNKQVKYILPRIILIQMIFHSNNIKVRGMKDAVLAHHEKDRKSDNENVYVFTYFKYTIL